MGLDPGTRLGPYEIGAPLGAGGMGVVYRARDTRLGRDVAIKVLPPEASQDRPSRDRFQHEARAIAALTHAHICAIHDVGVDQGLDYLVLELLEGESLAARLQRGPLTLHEAVTLALEIAQALGHAHRAGIVHRDLKPANIMLTKSGAKVLDFGLARMIQGAHAAVTQNTVTALLDTTPGAIMGTLPYMAPEQIEGHAVDARSDVFAFGATFYEMLAGKRAFDAPSGPSLMASILRDPTPSVRSIDASVPAAIDRVIDTCLAKNPDDRFSDMNAVGLALRWAAADAQGSAVSNARSMRPSPSSMTRRALIGSGLALVGGAAGFLIGRRPGPGSPGPSRSIFDLPFPPGFTPGPGIAMSPGGRWLAISLQPDQLLWLYDLASGRWFRPPNIKTNGYYPFWSPDGSELGYMSGFVGAPETKLWRVKVPDGVPTQVCDFESIGARMGAWCAGDTIVFHGGTTGLFKVPAAGGAPVEFLPRAPGETSLRFPTAAGRSIIYLVQQPSLPSELRQVGLDGSAPIKVPVATTTSAVVDGGSLFFLRRGVVVGQRYDVERAQTSGEPERVAQEVLVNAMNIGHLQVGAAAGHVAVANRFKGTSQLVWKSRDGRTLGPASEVGAFAAVAISPDARNAVVSAGVPDSPPDQLFVIDLETGVSRRLVNSDVEDDHPVWSRDGKRIAFRSLRGVSENGNLYAINADGSGTVSALSEQLSSMYTGGWDAMGAFMWSTDSSSTNETTGIWILDPGATDFGRPYLKGVQVNNARLSPDGSRIVYASYASGRREVYVDTYPVPGRQPVLVSKAGGSNVSWRGDGREVFFVSEGRLMAAAIVDSASLAAGPPEALFPIAAPSSSRLPYAAAADGRILVIEPRTAGSFTVKLTLNWTAP